MLLEDEVGQMNLIVPPPVYERYRALVRGEPLLLAHGRFERRDRNMNVLVDKVESLGPLAREVAEMTSASRSREHTTSATAEIRHEPESHLTCGWLPPNVSRFASGEIEAGSAIADFGHISVTRNYRWLPPALSPQGPRGWRR